MLHVSASYAIVHPRAVVVHAADATGAYAAVVGAWWLETTAARAIRLARLGCLCEGGGELHLQGLICEEIEVNTF